MARHLAQRLKLRQLRAVDAIAAHRSLLKASKAIGLSQPALTRVLQDVESAIGQPLFERHARGMTPTAVGHAVAASAKRILAEVGRLEEELDRLDSAAEGTVAVGALPVAAVGVMPATLARLKAAYPGLRVRLVQGRTEELLPMLASGELDLVVGRLYEPATPDGFSREPLYEEPIAFLARSGHPLLQVDGVRNLAGFDLVLPTIGQRIGQEIERLLADLGLERAVALRASSVGFIREMLHATDCITLMPRIMMAGDVARGTIGVVPLPIAMPPRPAGVIRRPDMPWPPGAEALVRCLREHVAEL